MHYPTPLIITDTETRSCPANELMQAELIPFVAGPLQMVFDPHSGWLRYIRCDDVEVVRGIYVAIRDKSWNSVSFETFDTQIGRNNDHFSLAWSARCISDEVAFEWSCNVTGSKRGTIAYHFDGQAQASFLRNRIGICLLHPIQECAGLPCTVEHTDSAITEARFPASISPHQLFKNVRSIVHAVSPNLEVKLSFEGDAFETEDQRNWTDASFKTYSTPLDRTYPVRLTPGERINQSVMIELQSADGMGLHAASASSPRPIRTESPRDEVRIRTAWNAPRPLPSLGFSIPHFASDPTDAVVASLKAASPTHLRVDLRLETDRWPERLQSALQLSEKIDTQLELAVFSDNTICKAWRDCLERLEAHRHKIAHWLVLSPTARATPEELIAASYTELTAFDPTIPIAFGTNANFAELNRNRPAFPEMTLACYSMHPQMHARDKLSLCEALQGQRSTVDSAYELFKREIVISPVTLLPRFNSTGTTPTSPPQYSEPPTDERQSTGFVAAWTAATLSQLAAHPHVASITFYESHGPRGIMDSEGKPFPTHRLLSTMRGCGQICVTTSSHPLEVIGLALVDANGNRSMVIGNLSSRPRTVVFDEGDGNRVAVVVDSEAIVHLSGSEIGLV